MILQLLSIAILSVIFWFILVRREKLKLREKLGVDGPPTSFLMGNMGQVGQYIKENGSYFHLFHKDVLAKKYGKVYGIYMGGHLQVYIQDLDMVKEILIKQFPNFVDRMYMMLSNTYPMLDTLICNKGQRWKDVRSVVSPTFSSGKLKQLAFIMDEKANIFMEVMAEKAKSGKTFDIFENYQALTLDVIGQSAFAVSVDCQRNFEDPFYVHCRAFFQGSDIEGRPFLMTAVIFNEFDAVFTLFRRFTDMGRAEAVLVNALETVVEQRMRDHKANKTMDILQILVEEAEDAKNATAGRKSVKLETSDIVGNCFVFLLAGYETTSTALAFTTWLLADNIEAQTKLQMEIDELLPDDLLLAGYETTSTALAFTTWLLADNIEAQTKLQMEIDELLPDGGSNWDVVSRMPYLDAVFHESLRYFPPVVMFVARTCVNETEVCGLRLTADTEVVIPVYSIHHDPSIWPEPHLFKPERFYKNKDWDPMGWLPFGAGPRNCIGLRFAEMEYKKTLVTLLKQYSVRFGEGSHTKMDAIARGALIAPKNGVVVKLVPRH